MSYSCDRFRPVLLTPSVSSPRTSTLQEMGHHTPSQRRGQTLFSFPRSCSCSRKSFAHKDLWVERRRAELPTSALRTQKLPIVSADTKAIIASAAPACTAACTGIQKTGHAVPLQKYRGGNSPLQMAVSTPSFPRRNGLILPITNQLQEVYLGSDDFGVVARGGGGGHRLEGDGPEKYVALGVVGRKLYPVVGGLQKIVAG